jgi:hypothetical protein
MHPNQSQISLAKQYQNLLRSQVFWDVMLCLWAGASRCSEGTYCLHLQGLKGQNPQPLKMKTKHSVKTLQNSNPVTKRHIPKDLDPQKHHFVNLNLAKHKNLVNVIPS